jgi:hypothetical protein
MPRALTAWLAVLGVTPMAAQTIHYEGGVSMTTGRYIFTERTTSWTVSTGLAVEWGRVTMRLTLPAHIQNTPLVSGSTIGPIPSGGSSSGAVADSQQARKGQSGPGSQTRSATALYLAGNRRVEVPPSVASGYAWNIGDPVASVGIALLAGGGTHLVVQAAAKAPVTDTTSFGTGAWDAGGTASFSHRIGQRSVVGAQVSYWILGDLPELVLRDPLSASLSLSHLIGRSWSAHASLWASQSVIDQFSNAYVVTLGVNRLTGRQSVGLSASVGFSETAPDIAVAVIWRRQMTD